MAYLKDNKFSSGRVVRLTLMISSIVLLVLFQIFWLVSSYRQVYVGFQRETSALLRSTVFSIRDSLFLSDLDHFIPNESDSTRPEDRRAHRSKVAMIRSENLRLDVRHEMLWDSLNVIGEVNNPPDTEVRHRNFVIRIRADDTLSTAALHDRYKAEIEKANYTSPFLIDHQVRALPRINTRSPDSLDSEVKKGERNGPVKRRAISISYSGSNEQRFKRIISIFRDTLVTEQVAIGPIHAYTAVFPNMRSNIIMRIAPQLLFSAFLSAITIAAFIIMYRNLRSQERVVAIKNDFISNVTHELKTPIATVSVALEALKDFNALKNPVKTAEYLNIAQYELNRLSLMTDKILKASVFEQHGVVFDTGVVRFDDIVRQVTESLTVVLDKKNIKATVHLKGSHFELVGSEVHLTNVVYNLLDNAIKYSPSNTAIDIDLRESEESITLIVRDQGIGIDPMHQKRIFEKFFRVPTGDVHNTRGYGLGLNYVADVVRSHGGKVSVNSVPGQGSSFTIHLPKKHGR